MIRKLIGLLALLALLLGVLAACGDDDGAYYNSACVNPATQVRLDYSRCDSHPGWIYYFPAGVTAPRVGAPVSDFNKSGFKRPSGATIKSNGIPKTGGKVPLIKTGPGVKVYKPPANNGGGVKQPGGGFKAPAPRPVAPAPRIGR